MNFETFDKKFSKVENLVCPPFVIAMKMAMAFFTGAAIPLFIDMFFI